LVKFAIATLGCKVNQYESAGIIEGLEGRGFSNVPFDSEADIYIVNTCTITAKTDYQSRQLIRRANRKSPSASIIVTGCYAQIAPHELAGLAGVRAVVGMEEKENIPFTINELIKGTHKIITSDISLKKNYSGLFASKFPGHTRAFLKIQDGCNAFCSYCIIPYARGRSRSLPENDVIKQIKDLNDAGYREIVLTGIHLGIYGHDLSPFTSFLNLLRKIENADIIERLRISSIEPVEITDGLINHIKNSRIICRHLHIPLQSGDDRILNLMKRNYNTRQFRNRIEKIIDAVPEIAIGMDVIVGFPGEGEKEFNNTRDFVEGIPLAYLHVFPYSRRPGTEASQFPDQVDESIKKERGKILRDMGKKKRMEFNKRFIGKKLSVLVENTKDGETGFMKGFSDNYIPVLIPAGNVSMSNHIVKVRAESLTGGKILGRKPINF